MDTPCVVCEEVCPTSPKAIYSREVEVTTRYGEQLRLRQPYEDPVVCIGCGICEHECPVRDQRAIRVTAVGETRSTDRTLLLILVEGDAAQNTAMVGGGSLPAPVLTALTALSLPGSSSDKSAPQSAGGCGSGCSCATNTKNSRSAL
jgi:ferredoxin